MANVGHLGSRYGHLGVFGFLHFGQRRGTGGEGETWFRNPVEHPHEDDHDATEAEQDVASLVTRTPRERSRERDREARRSRSRQQRRTPRDTPRTMLTSNPTNTSRAWRTAPWRTGDDEEHEPDNPRRPRATSSTRTFPTSESSSRSNALNLNRHMWRGLLGISHEGPCTNYSESLPRAFPMDMDVAENIFATVRNMPDGDRAAFLAGYLRFLLEVSQQICEIMVRGDPRANPNDLDWEEEDNMMMVQSSMEVRQKMRRTFQSFQHALEASGDEQAGRARVLRSRLKTRYYGVPNDLLHSEVHEFDAVLLVYEDGNAEDCQAPPPHDWIDHWWRNIVEMLDQLDAMEGITAAPTRITSTASTTVDLDTPPLRAQGFDDGDHHDWKLQDQQAQEEEEYHRRELEAVQQIMEAEAAQRADDEALRQEMNKPRNKKQRLQVDVIASSSNSS